MCSFVHGFFTSNPTSYWAVHYSHRQLLFCRYIPVISLLITDVRFLSLKWNSSDRSEPESGAAEDTRRNLQGHMPHSIRAKRNSHCHLLHLLDHFIRNWIIVRLLLYCKGFLSYIIFELNVTLNHITIQFAVIIVLYWKYIISQNFQYFDITHTNEISNGHDRHCTSNYWKPKEWPHLKSLSSYYISH